MYYKGPRNKKGPQVGGGTKATIPKGEIEKWGGGASRKEDLEEPRRGGNSPQGKEKEKGRRVEGRAAKKGTATMVVKNRGPEKKSTRPSGPAKVKAYDTQKAGIRGGNFSGKILMASAPWSRWRKGGRESAKKGGGCEQEKGLSSKRRRPWPLKIDLYGAKWRAHKKKRGDRLKKKRKKKVDLATWGKACTGNYPGQKGGNTSERGRKKKGSYKKGVIKKAVAGASTARSRVETKKNQVVQKYSKRRASEKRKSQNGGMWCQGKPW